MISFEVIVYLLCFVSSALCAYLLSNAFRLQREKAAALEQFVFLLFGIEQSVGFYRYCSADLI